MPIRNKVRLLRSRDLVLGNLLERLAEIHGDQPMVEEADGGLRLTFREAADRVAAWAGGIAAQTDPGDAVVIATANGYEQMLLVLATSRAGRMPAPVNSHMSASEVDHVVADCGATLRITSVDEIVGGTPMVRSVPAEHTDVGALFYTSGTTGKPKGAELTHRGLIEGVTAAALFPSGIRKDELVMALPVAHIFGFMMVAGAACAGVPVYFLPKFNPVKVLDAIERRGSTVFAGVPAMYRMLMDAGAEDRDLSTIRVWISGADAMPVDLANRFKDMGASVRLPGLGAVGQATFAEGYGMVETAGGVAIRLSLPMVPVHLGGSVGVPLPGYRFRVVDENGKEVARNGVGELLVSGPGILKGYHGAPEATAVALTEDGWLRTGDLARRGLLGTFTFEGRAKDVIKRGGYSVYAIEVEQALEEHPDVIEAAVVPLPDERDGEVPGAAVRLRQGVALADLDLDVWAKERLSTYKVPVRFIEVEEFPRTGTDKVQRREVAKLF
jgi:long-chain acyl-CoA synthetase